MKIKLCKNETTEVTIELLIYFRTPIANSFQQLLSRTGSNQGRVLIHRMDQVRRIRSLRIRDRHHRPVQHTRIQVRIHLRTLERTRHSLATGVSRDLQVCKFEILLWKVLSSKFIKIYQRMQRCREPARSERREVESSSSSG